MKKKHHGDNSLASCGTFFFHRFLKKKILNILDIQCTAQLMLKKKSHYFF